MTELIVLFSFLIVIFMLCIYISKRIKLNPQVCFVASFIPQVFYAFFLRDVWNINISKTTLYIYIVGILNFIIVSWLVCIVDDMFHHKNTKLMSSCFAIHKDLYRGITHSKGGCVQIDRWKLIIFAIFQIGAIGLAASSLIRITGAESLGKAASLYNEVNKYGTVPYHLPLIVGQFRHIAEASGYLWSYYLVCSLVYRNNKGRILLIINLLLSIISPIILGQRLGTVRLLFTFAFMYYVVYGIKINWKFKIKVSTIIKIGLVVILVPVLFYYSLTLMGRSTERTIMEYLGIYISGEIKIFDTFVRTGQYGRKFLESQTISTIIRYIAKWFGISNLGQKDSYPFLFIAGKSIGNASTIFYNYYLDAGFCGVLIYTNILALFSQIWFRKAIRNENGYARVSLLSYGYVFFCLLFAFFDDFFFKHIVSPIFIFYVLYWIIIRFFIEKIRLGPRR